MDHNIKTVALNLYIPNEFYFMILGTLLVAWILTNKNKDIKNITSKLRPPPL